VALVLLCAPPAISRENALKKMGPDMLLKMTRGGMFAYLERSGGVELPCGAVLVNATPQKVWDTITDFKNYPKLITQIQNVKVKEKKKDGATVTLSSLLMRVGPLKIATEGDQIFKFSGNNHIDILPGDKKDKTTWGAWDLVPVEGGKKTVLIYAFTSDVGAGGGVAKSLIEREPTLNVSINLANIMVMLEGMKRGAEKK
jgi:carbon monoxide dehydrogenase subunit G